MIHRSYRLAALLTLAAAAVLFVWSAGRAQAEGPPASSGPYVVRSETAYAYLYPDFRAGMIVVLGGDAVEFCNGIIDFDVVPLLEISVPEDANRLVNVVQGDDVRTSVWPFTNFDCALITSVPPLATGESDVMITDNDLNVQFNPDNVNANAFGSVAHGLLTDVTGNPVSFLGVNRCVWDGNDRASQRCTGRVFTR